MAKVFTITPGLENMGAMKTGGQGSVYKARRIGEVITAIKLLPTPIFNESEEDKNYRDFTNEVEKLKKVNEEPNPNVVKILSSGLSETGNFPYIEMEYIEGPDLEDLLKPPHEPVFTVKEVIKVADQLSNALAHCHKNDVKHGDIKSNNVKFNLNTGNYILLDFGLAVMSDEQRRTSLRHAGAVEFMAPEQNEGEVLFETDVYSFGVVLFELVAGRVPFPLEDKTETARNTVRLAHMETPVPDVVAIRRDKIPLEWGADKREREMKLPAWLISLVNKCLEKRPERRFRNGVELHDYIVYNITHSTPAAETILDNFVDVDQDELLTEKQRLEKQLLQYREEVNQRDYQLANLKVTLDRKNGEVNEKTPSDNISTDTLQKGVSLSSFITLLMLAVGLVAFAGYSYFRKSQKEKSSASTAKPAGKDTITSVDSRRKVLPKQGSAVAARTKKTDTAKQKIKTKATNSKGETIKRDDSIVNDSYEQSRSLNATQGANNTNRKYTVLSKAFFYNTPDESTKRNAYIVSENNAVLSPIDDQNGFIYVVYTNARGQISKGWMRKRDLRPLD